MQPIQRSPAQSAPPVERRFSPRIRVTYRVELKSGAERIVGHTTDVSGWGLFVETRQMLDLGSKVRMSFAVGGSAHDIVEAHGTVARRVTPEEGARSVHSPGLGIAIDRFLWGQDRFFAAYNRLLEGSDLSAGPRLVKGHRRTRRADVGLPMYWGDGTGGVDRAGFITNLSKSGAFFLEAPPVQPGSRLQLWFEVPLGGTTRRVQAIATVVRVVGDDSSDGSSGPRGMGVRLETSTLDAKILEKFLDDRLDDPERREGVRRHRETFGTEIDDLVLQALEAVDADPAGEPPASERETSGKGLRPGERRYRLVEMDTGAPTVDWAQVGSVTFRVLVVGALALIGMILFQVVALL